MQFEEHHCFDWPWIGGPLLVTYEHVQVMAHLCTAGDSLREFDVSRPEINVYVQALYWHGFQHLIFARIHLSKAHAFHHEQAGVRDRKVFEDAITA